MIDLKLSFQPTVDSLGLTISDQTVWPSDGIERVDARLHLFVLRYLGEQTFDEVFGGDALPANVASWTLAEAKDGYYKTLIVSAPAHNPAAAYSKNSLVDSEGILYVALKDLIAGTSLTAENCWKMVTKLTDITSLTSFPNASYLIAHYLRSDDASKCLGEKALAYAKKSCGCSDTCSQIEDYHWTLVYFNAALNAFVFGDYKDAGKLLGGALDRCGSSTSSPCNCH